MTGVPVRDRGRRCPRHVDLSAWLCHWRCWGLVPGWRGDGRLKANVEALGADMAALADSSRGLDAWSNPAELRAAIGDLRTEVSALSRKLDSGQGTLGRLLRDQELYVQIRVLRLGLRDLMAAIREDPMGSVNIELF